MSNTLLYSLLYIVSVLVSSFSQVLLKYAARKSYRSRVAEYLNPWVCSAYALFFGSTLLTTFCLRYLELSTGTILESSGYIFVFLLSYSLLKEKISRRKLLGMAIILIGIFIFTL